MSCGIGIFVKTPSLSPVKTRLWPGLGRSCSEALYLVSAEAVASVAETARRGANLQPYWAVAEAAAMQSDAWADLPHLSQGVGSLGERMAQVYRMLRLRHHSAILIGADTPQLVPEALERAAHWLASVESRLVIGRAHDGGFWLFGGNVALPDRAWLSAQYSTTDTGDAVRRGDAGIRPLAGAGDAARHRHRDGSARRACTPLAARCADAGAAAAARLAGYAANDDGGVPVSTWFLAHAGPTRLLVVAVLLALLLAWQRFRPRRGDAAIPKRQWRNIALVLLASAVVYLLVPVTTVVFAASLASAGIGLFNMVALPTAVELLLGIVLLDVAIYWQHRWFHLLPWLWRIHRVHHSDIGFDATLGLRFHPAEILLSLLYKLALIAAFGFAPLTVLVYEILLASFALFTHADISLPARWDTRLRRVFVTPDWHRVHHSIHRDETDSNYGNLLSVWDRLFASHVAQPRDGHVGMRIGLTGFRDACRPNHRFPAAPALGQQIHRSLQQVIP